MYANIFTQVQVSTLPQLPGRVACTFDNSREEYLYEGWRIVTKRTAIPDGATVTGTRYEQDPDDIAGCIAVYEYRTTEQAADDEAARLMGLVAANKERLIAIAGLLAVFNLPLPCPYSAARESVHTQSKADPSKAADGVLLMELWDEFEAAVAEPDRMAVITLMKGGA